MSAERACLPTVMWLAQITHRGFFHIRIKVRDLIMKVSNSSKNHSCRLPSDQIGRLCYWCVLQKQNIHQKPLKLNSKDPYSTFLTHAGETCPLSSQTHILLQAENREMLSQVCLFGKSQKENNVKINGIGKLLLNDDELAGVPVE